MTRHYVRPLQAHLADRLRKTIWRIHGIHKVKNGTPEEKTAFAVRGRHTNHCNDVTLVRNSLHALTTFKIRISTHFTINWPG